MGRPRAWHAGQGRGGWALARMTQCLLACLLAGWERKSIDCLDGRCYEDSERTVTMPRLDENTQQYLQDAEQGVRSRASGAWDSFTNFALRDNVLEVAVGLM